jgi:hypothetical protein
MTRSELLTKLARRTNKNTTLDTATQNRLLDFLNERMRRLLSLPGMQRLRDVTLPLASVASQAEYALPAGVKVSRITDPTNDRNLLELSMQDYRLYEPDPQTGTPTHYVWRGRQAVAKQPAAACALFVDSTAAGDTGTCYVEGVTTGGYPRSVSVSMTGVTAVNISTAVTDWIRVDKFYLSAAAVGVVTLHETASGGTEIARIGIGQTDQDYVGLTLWPTPSAVVTYTVDAVRAVTDLAQSNDEPMLPEDFHDVILLGALADEYEHMDDPRWQQATLQHEKRVGQLRYWLHETAAGTGPLNGAAAPPSQLGAWFPAGT